MLSLDDGKEGECICSFHFINDQVAWPSNIVVVYSIFLTSFTSIVVSIACYCCCRLGWAKETISHSHLLIISHPSSNLDGLPPIS